MQKTVLEFWTENQLQWLQHFGKCFGIVSKAVEVLSCRISSIKVIADKYFENINSFELRRIEKKITKRTSTDYSSARKQGSSKTSLRMLVQYLQARWEIALKRKWKQFGKILSKDNELTFGILQMHNSLISFPSK